MIGPHSRKATEQVEVERPIAWYAWEAAENDDAWLISYVDLLSILLAAVVVLLGQMAVKQLPLSTQTEPSATVPSAIPIQTMTPTGSESETVDPQERKLSREARLADLVEERFQGQVRAVQQEQGVTLEIAEAVLFDSAKAVLRESASSMLIYLATTLQATGANIAVEGHTDNRPVQNGNFSSNWELAAARAYAVTRFLIAHGLPAERLRLVSYADTRPAHDNGTVAGRAANRRVKLRVEFLTEIGAIAASVSTVGGDV
jgi:chemotaxis protein MotB